jgi:cell division protein YceG involved in septum cleavage
MKKETLVFIFTFFVVLIAITGAMSFTGNNENLANFHQVEIKEGDSIWSIAEKYRDNTKISKQEFVVWVQEKNDIHSSVIKPGDLVYVPVEKEELYQVEQIASSK